MKPTTNDTREWLSPKQTATVVRKVLREAFPATRFSVTTARGSMVYAVDVRWTDGPTTARVDAIVKRFEAGHFDGMTDSYEYDRNAVILLDGKKYRPGCKYVMTHRTVSDALRNRCAAQVAAYFGEPVPSPTDHNARCKAAGEYWSTLIYRAAADATRYAR